MEPLAGCWFPVALSADVGRSPHRATLLGRELVVFRGANGVGILEDRCPHRGVALSTGVVRDGHLQCAYHGWTFDRGGACTGVPSLLADDRLPESPLPAYHATESGGLIWACVGDEPDEPAPQPWRLPRSTAYVSTFDVAANYVRLMENLVDNPHSGYIHAGLIRREPTTEVRATITRDSAGVVIRTVGEKATSNSLLYRIFGRRGEDVEHVEECRLPSTMMSTYSQRGRIAAMESVIAPIDDTRCRWFFRISLEFGPLTRPLFPIFKRAVLRVVAQDRDIVSEVGTQENRFPNRRYVSTAADTPSLVVAKAANSFADTGPADITTTEHEIGYLL